MKMCHLVCVVVLAHMIAGGLLHEHGHVGDNDTETDDSEPLIKMLEVTESRTAESIKRSKRIAPRDLVLLSDRILGSNKPAAEAFDRDEDVETETSTSTSQYWENFFDGKVDTAQDSNEEDKNAENLAAQARMQEKIKSKVKAIETVQGVLQNNTQDDIHVDHSSDLHLSTGIKVRARKDNNPDLPRTDDAPLDEIKQATDKLQYWSKIFNDENKKPPTETTNVYTEAYKVAQVYYVPQVPPVTLSSLEEIVSARRPYWKNVLEGNLDTDSPSSTEKPLTTDIQTDPAFEARNADRLIDPTRPLAEVSTAATLPVATTQNNPIDIKAIMDIVDNLTYWYEAQLVDELRQRLSTSADVTSPPTEQPLQLRQRTISSATDDDVGNVTGVVMGKCFVCGLEDEEIPRNTHCADAFSGDFLPLSPVDPTSRGLVGSYRKYCRYMDVPRPVDNSSDPRSTWGRWSGGCAVRWVDLSGVYTQRVCRDRNHAVVGRHFASKRMAKLEMALQNINNGCIVSPMASLVPFSRGVSLYARFHACVCTGNWCNTARAHAPGAERTAIAGLLAARATLSSVHLRL